MKRRIFLLLAAACALAAQPVWAGSRAAQKDAIESVLRLVDAGLSDGVIVRYISTRAFVFELTDEDLMDLRKRGVSNTVLEAMLDTAPPAGPATELETAPDSEQETASEPVREEAESHVSVVLSAGWFSPWYYYPSAWGFYYDPFPVWYSYYYYPFRFCSSWGYYGYCSNYYYPNCWRPYRYWNDPWCYQTAMTHPGVPVRTPRTDVITWRTGRGVPSARPHYISTSGSPRASTGNRGALETPTVRRRVAHDAVHARPPEYSGASAASPRRAPRDAAPAPAPRSRPSRSADPAPAPRYQAPSSHSAAPAAAPRSMPSSHFAPRGGSTAPAPRSGGVPMAPRSSIGAGARLGR